MCGIVGFTGKRPAAPYLIEGLEKLEYRGYDSAGVALMGEDGLSVTKFKGRLKILSDYMNGGLDYPQQTGIGHTRWATHGKPSDENSHPHTSFGGKFAVVHNGIIENYLSLKKDLEAKGIKFVSQTDTEVIAHLLEANYSGDFFEAVKNTVKMLQGSYALGIICTDFPNEIFAVRKASPLIIGVCEEGNFIASDIPAVLPHTRKVIQLLDNEMARITKDNVVVWDENLNITQKPIRTIEWDVDAAEKGGYDHFMLKEIMEQPKAVSNAVLTRINNSDEIVPDGINFTKEELENINKIYVIACGSAYHAGVVGKYYIESLVGIPVEVDYASEFRYRDPLVDEHTLAIVISQSGETADTLAGLREAKSKGARILSIVNVVGSTIAGESDDVLYTMAGPEIAVATTKGYTTQVAMIYLLGVYMAKKLEKISPEVAAEYIDYLKNLPNDIEKGLENIDYIKDIARRCTDIKDVFFIGRNVDYAICLEASLKLKEISYIHSEAYAAGELKHGTISLIEDGTFVIAIACNERLAQKTRSNIKEVKARGAHVLVVTKEKHKNEFSEADEMLIVPDAPEIFSAVSEIVPLQILSYYIALYRDCDIDKPRNLAKSVTVE